MRSIIAMLVASATLFAGPPMISDDPFVPDEGQFEINLAAGVEDRDETIWYAPIVDFNYGFAPGFQFTATTAYDTAPQGSGMDAFALALKWYGVHHGHFDMAASVTYQSFPVDTIFNAGESYMISLPMSYDFENGFSLVVSPSYIYMLNGGDHAELGSYLEYDFSNQSLFAELYLEEGETHDRAFTLCNLGYLWQMNEMVALTVSLGRELNAQERIATVGYAGLQFVF